MARVWRDGPSARLGKGRTGRKPISASKSSNKTNILEFGLVQAFFSPIAYKQQRRKPPGWQPFWRQLHREMERGEEGSGDWGGGQEIARIPLPVKLQCCGGGEVKRGNTSESLLLDIESCCQVRSRSSDSGLGSGQGLCSGGLQRGCCEFPGSSLSHVS